MKYHIGQRVVDYESARGEIIDIMSSPPIKPYLVKLDSGKEFRYYEDSLTLESYFDLRKALAQLADWERAAWDFILALRITEVGTTVDALTNEVKAAYSVNGDALYSPRDNEAVHRLLVLIKKQTIARMEGWPNE